MTGHIGIGRIKGYTRPPTIRLYNPATDCFLHLSGQGETASEDYAWSGYPHQARALRDRAAEWPYRRRIVMQRPAPIPD